MRLTKYEKGTIINFNAGEPDASLCTRDPAVMQRLDRLVAACPDVCCLDGVSGRSKTYSVSRSYVDYRKPRHLTDERRTGDAGENGKVSEHDR